MKITVLPGFWLMLALSVLFLGLEATLALICGIFIHESGHGIAVALFSGRVEALRMDMAGLTMESAFPKLPSYGQELFCAAAGPLANFLAGGMAAAAGAFLVPEHTALYLLAGANLSLGVFNLIPVAGFDGGRILALFLEHKAGPMAAVPLQKGIHLAATLFLLWLAAAVFFKAGRNFALLLSLLYPAGLGVHKMMTNSPSQGELPP